MHVRRQSGWSEQQRFRRKTEFGRKMSDGVFAKVQGREHQVKDRRNDPGPEHGGSQWAM